MAAGDLHHAYFSLELIMIISSKYLGLAYMYHKSVHL